MVQEFLSGRQTLSAARELTRIFEKISAVRKRVLMLAVFRALLGASWFWLVSLFALGAVCAFLPTPGPLRLLLRLTHFVLIGAGAWLGARSAAAGTRSIRGLRLRTWALHCEELHPEMRGRLVTCVDLAQEPGGQGAFELNPVAKALLRETAVRFREFDPLVAAPMRRFALIQFGVALPILLFALIFFWRPDYTRATLAGLYLSGASGAAGAGPLASGVPGLTVTPGDVDVPRGSTVKVQAELDLTGVACELEEVALKSIEHTPKGDHTQVLTMLKDEKSRSTYHLALLNVKDPAEYQVTLTALDAAKRPVTLKESAIFKITPYDPPEIESMKGVVRAPVGLRIADKAFDAAYISGLAKSGVTLTIQSNQPLRSARLVEESGAALDGKLSSEGPTAGRLAEFQFSIDGDKSYRLELVNTSNRTNVDPPLVQVHVTPDLPPTLTVKRPGADWSVHRIAEVSFEAEATDDFGLCDVSLEYRLNDGAVVNVPLYAAPADAPLSLTQKVTTTLALEDLNVVVGDSIYYRFVAHDSALGSAGAGAAKRAGYSQPYFLAIRPFEQIFLNGGAGAPVVGPQAPTEHQVIVATTRVADRGDSMSVEERKSTLDDISRTQREVQVATERVKERMSSSPDLPNRAERAAHLDSAVAEMKKAEQLLDAGDPSSALAPENSALRHLIAAVAGLPELEGWMNGTVPSPYPPEPPTSLSEQKVDAKKDQYEMADTAKAPKVEQELSDALERVRALSQRQKEFTETLKREEPPTGSGIAGANYVDSRASAEESRHQLERLSETVEKLEGVDEETKNKLREGLDRAARELARVDESLSKKDAVQAQGNNARAMDTLHELELNLQKALAKNSKNRLRNAQVRLNDWIERQKALQSALAGLKKTAPSEQQTARTGLGQRQSQLGAEEQKIGQTLSSSAGDGAGDTQKILAQVAQNLEQAASASETASKALERSDDATATAAQGEALKRLEEAREAVAKALERSGASKNSKIAQALVAVQDIKRAVAPDSEMKREERPTRPTSNELRKQLENVQSMVGRDPEIGPAIQQMLAQLKEQSPQGQEGQQALQGQQGQGQQGQQGQGQGHGHTSSAVGGSTGAGGHSPNVSESYTKMLNDLEEMLLDRLQLEEQAQRLQQTPADALPARFRDMASKYFEALGSERANTSSNAGASHGKP